jgi:hypothetical protein
MTRDGHNALETLSGLEILCGWSLSCCSLPIECLLADMGLNTWPGTRPLDGNLLSADSAWLWKIIGRAEMGGMGNFRAWSIS